MEYIETNIYIFITPSIVSIGGAELYVSNKMKHLQQMGWKVLVCSFSRGEVKIDNLKAFIPYINRVAGIKYERTDNKTRHEYTKQFAKYKGARRVIIESHTTNLAYWAELVASEIHAVHLTFLLTETFPKLNSNQKNFFEKKYNQKMLYGIKPQSIANLMGNSFEYKDTLLLAMGGNYNVVSPEIEYDIDELPNADYKILSLGRLNKPYVISMMESVSLFAQRNMQSQVLLTMLGGYGDEKIHDFSKKLESQHSNLKVAIMNEMNPIPQNIFLYHDAAIAVAGCATICSQQGLPTITIDANDHKGIGVLNETTNNNTLRVDEPALEVNDVLEDILVKKKYPKRIPISNKKGLNYDAHDAIMEIPYDFKYYPLNVRDSGILNVLNSIVMRSLGVGLYLKINDIVNSIRH